MPVLKDHYYRLASELPQERIEAATGLLSELSEENNNEDWDYALNRLIKGLTSTRQSARLGFSMALIEVLRELVTKSNHELTVTSFLKHVYTLSEVKSSMKGKEERSVLFGRLFGLQVLLNSQLLFDEKVSTLEALVEFVDVLVELSSLKSWLRETSIFTLCQFIGLLDNNTHRDKVLVHVLQKINDFGLNLTTEGIAVYLSIPQQTREKFASKISNPKPNWKNGDPLSKGNLPVLAKALKDVEVVEAETQSNDTSKSKNGNKQKGSWSPRIHFVWDIIIKNYNSIETTGNENDYVEKEDSKKRKKSSTKSSKKQKKTNELEIPLKELWKVVIDETLFSEKSSHERKYWGFEIFIKFLSSIKSNDIPSIFTPNFMRCLINQSSQPNRMLNKISTKVLSSINSIAAEEFTKVPVILECLLDDTKGGCWNFDLVTKSKCVDKLIGFLNGKDSPSEYEIDMVLNQLKDVLVAKFNVALETQDDEVDGENEAMKHSNDNIQKWALDKLLLLFRSNKAVLSDNKLSVKWLEKLLKLLVQHSFFQKTNEHKVSLNVRKLCQDRLNSILSDIINAQMKDHSWPLTTCIMHIKKLDASDKYIALLEFDDELQKVKEETFEILNGIDDLFNLVNKKQSYKIDQLRCFKLLFSMILIQFYMGDEEAVTVLDELKMCYDNTFVSLETQDDTIDSTVVLTEIILSFVSRKSTLLKKISTIAWESFLCSKDDSGKLKLTEECLQLLFDVLEARENKEGQQKLFEAQDEFQAEGDSDDNSHSENEDEDAENSVSENEDVEDDSDDDDEEKPDDAVSEVDKQTNLKLAQALGIPTESSGEVKFEDLDSSDEEDEDSSYESDDMNDDEMMAMDDQLSKIFKERHEALSTVVTGNKRKAEVIEAKEQMHFFKNRILDLLELFTKTQPGSHLNLSMIKPLIILINLTLDKNLGVKAHKLLKLKVSKCKISEEELNLNFPSKSAKSQYKESLMDLIKWLHEETGSSKSSNLSHSMACNQSCIIIAKNLISIDELYLEKVIDLYAESLKSWASNYNSKIQASMFFDFINWLNSKRSP